MFLFGGYWGILNNWQEYQPNLGKGLRRVNAGNAVFRIISKHRLRLSLVKFEAAADHFLVRIIQPIIFQGALFQPHEQGIAIRTGKMEHLLYLNHSLHDPRLAYVSRS